MSVVALAVVALAHAQGEKGSLTEQFPNMSAKDRSRIAAKESEEAKKDATYQDVMQRAERSFQEGRYEEAIKQYEEARAMRPYNVYPKVKIEDLRALLARQAAKQDSAAMVEEHPVDPDPVVPPEVPAPDPVVSEKSVPLPEPVVEKSTARAVAGAPEKRAEGVIEQRYREGHAFVIERAVTVEGRLVKYKRVYHPYGQVFYFEDGLAVDERVWKARFPER